MDGTTCLSPYWNSSKKHLGAWKPSLSEIGWRETGHTCSGPSHHKASTRKILKNTTHTKKSEPTEKIQTSRNNQLYKEAIPEGHYTRHSKNIYHLPPTLGTLTSSSRTYLLVLSLWIISYPTPREYSGDHTWSQIYWHFQYIRHNIYMPEADGLTVTTPLLFAEISTIF